MKNKNALFYTPFSEEYARRCIMRCFPELNWNLVLKDSDPPDLIDSSKGVGVEVTRPKSKITQLDAELDSILSKYIGKTREEIPKPVIKKLNNGDEKRLVFFEDPSDGKSKLLACFHDVRVIDTIPLMNAIVEKTKKLNKADYDYYNIDALFINDVHSFIFDISLSELIEDIELIQAPRKFSILFIYCFRDIWCINISNKRIQHKRLSDDQIEEMKMQSLIELGRV